ncbi:hypothetical protein FB451DRAFT_1446843 [Mycena latifolia]|nr:hypothetical protein FB451DRAFT_1446843 [Mycena latifolia]
MRKHQRPHGGIKIDCRAPPLKVRDRRRKVVPTKLLGLSPQALSLSSSPLVPLQRTLRASGFQVHHARPSARVQGGTITTLYGRVRSPMPIGIPVRRGIQASPTFSPSFFSARLSIRTRRAIGSPEPRLNSVEDLGIADLCRIGVIPAVLRGTAPFGVFEHASGLARTEFARNGHCIKYSKRTHVKPRLPSPCRHFTVCLPAGRTLVENLYVAGVGQIWGKLRA